MAKLTILGRMTLIAVVAVVVLVVERRVMSRPHPISSSMSKTISWEHLESDSGPGLMRLPTPSGWLVEGESGIMVVVHDPEHAWLKPEGK